MRKLIVIEGLDGSGKTTVTSEISKILESEGFNVLALREPGGTEIGYEIRKTLLEFKNTGMCSRAEVLLFNAARAQLVYEKVAPFLEKGGIVLLDRFYGSTLAYQGFGRGEDLYTLNSIISYAVGEVRPDLTIYLSISPEKALSRKGKAENRLDREPIEFYERVHLGYLRMAESSESWQIVDAEQNLDKVIGDCVALIRTLIS